VKRYAAMMADGKWVLTGEAIKFDDQGILIDGQHRLWAVIESGAVISSLVIEGVGHEAFAWMDQGKRRNLADFFTMQGYAQAHQLAATIRTIHRYKVYRRFRAAGQFRDIDPYAAVALAKEHPEIQDIIRVSGQHVYAPMAITRSLLSAMHFLFSEVDEEDAEGFMEQLGTGLASRPTDPVYILRETYIRMRSTSTHSVSQRDHDYMGAIGIKAWNAYRMGEDISLLRWRRGGAKPENMPEIL
jgi:hypothetical protein